MAGGTKDDRAEFLRLSQERAFIIGADEVGTGAWAGPIVTCAVAVPRDWSPPPGLNDSKKIRPEKRNLLFEILRTKVPYFCELASATEVDQDGLRPALRRCFQVCFRTLKEKFPDSVLILDGDVRVPEVDHLLFPKADGEVPAVMAASIIAKEVRDRIMIEMGHRYPGYKFGIHMGYGVPEHAKALKEKGLCPIHRRSYAPIGGGKLKTAEELKAADDEGMAVDD